MKKILMFLVVLAGAMAFGAANDTIITFSTKGPDTYKDGKVVLDGECYALVWTKDGATFGGFSADGSLLSPDDKLVVVVACAKGGKCPTTLFEIAAGDVEKNYQGGAFALYLLDTRVKDAVGNVTVGGTAKLAQTVPSVNAVGAIQDGASIAADGQGTIAGGTTKLAQVGTYAKLGEPTITGFAVKGANIELTVKDMYEAADYFVVPGNAPNSFGKALEVKPKGNTFKFKQQDDATFFKVIGVRKFE